MLKSHNSYQISNHMIRCKHCNVDACYNMTIEDLDSELVCTSLCIKCVKIETKKIIDSFSAVKSLKIEPLLSPLIETET